MSMKVGEIMDDVITIDTKINTIGFQRGCKELSGAISSMSKTAGKMTGIIKKAVAVVIGIGSVYQATTKAAKSFMSQNDNVSRRLQSVWTALGNVLAPVIEGIVSGVVNAVSYMLSFLKLVGVQAGSPATSTKGNGKAKADMKNTVSGFDELNVLSDNSGSGSAANKAGLADIEPTEWMKNLAGLLISGQFAEAGKEVAEKLNQIVSAIDWEGAGKKIAACFKGAVDFLGNAVRDFDIRSLSKNLTRSLNSAMYADSEGESAWESSGRLLYARFTSVFDFRMGFLEALDWAAFIKAYTDYRIGQFKAIIAAIERTDWERLFKVLCDIATNIDFAGFYASGFRFVGAYYGSWGSLIAGCLKGAFEEISEYFSSAFYGLGDLTWDGFVQGLKRAATSLYNFIKDYLIKPFVDGFKNAFGIHSPSTVMERIGGFVIAGFLNGCVNTWLTVILWIATAKGDLVKSFKQFRDSVSDTMTEAWDGIRIGATEMWEGMGGLFDSVSPYFESGFAAAWDGIFSVFSGGGVLGSIRDAVNSAFRKILNSVITGINTAVAIPFSGINHAINTVSQTEFMGFQPFSTMQGWAIESPQIPLLAKGGILADGQIGLLEGAGAEAAVSVRDQKWITAFAQAFLNSVQCGAYGLSEGTQRLYALNTISGSVPFRVPAIAAGSILPHVVNDKLMETWNPKPKSGLYPVLAELLKEADSLRGMVESLGKRQFVADFGHGERYTARKISREQKR